MSAVTAYHETVVTGGGRAGPPRPPESGERLSQVDHEQLVRVYALAGIPEGWDGRRAPPPAPVALAGAVLVLVAARHLAPERVEIGPATDGGVDLMFDDGDVWLSAMCANDGTISLERSDGTEETLDSPPSLSALERHTAWMMAAG